MNFYTFIIFILISLLVGCQVTPAIKQSKENLPIIRQLAFSPDGHSLAYTASLQNDSDSRYIGLWALKSGTLKRVNKVIQHDFETLFFSPEGNKLALMYKAQYPNPSGTHYGFIWHIATHSLSEKYSYLPSYQGPTAAIAVSPDKQLTAQPDSKGRIRLWNNASQKIIKTYQFEDISTLNRLWFTPDNKRLVLIGQTSHRYHYSANKKYKGPTLIISVDLSEASEQQVLDTKNNFSSFQKHSHRLITSNDNTVNIWDSDKQKLIQKMNYVGRMTHMQLSHNGHYLAAILHSDFILLSDDQPIEMENRRVTVIWDVNTGLPVHVLTDTTQSIKCLAINPDNKTLATGDDLGVIRLWDIKTGDMIKQIAITNLTP